MFMVSRLYKPNRNHFCQICKQKSRSSLTNSPMDLFFGLFSFQDLVMLPSHGNRCTGRTAGTAGCARSFGTLSVAIAPEFDLAFKLFSISFFDKLHFSINGNINPSRLYLFLFSCGITTENTVTSFSLDTITFPPCRSTIRFTMARPTPLPWVAWDSSA